MVKRLPGTPPERPPLPVVVAVVLMVVPHVNLRVEAVLERIPVQQQLDQPQTLQRVQGAQRGNLQKEGESVIELLEQKKRRNPHIHLILAQVEDLQVGRLLDQLLEVRHLTDLVVVQVQRLQLRNILGDYLERLRHERGTEQGAEDVQQIWVRVELGQVEGLCGQRVPLHHGQFHALHHRVVHTRLRHVVRDQDSHLVAAGHLNLPIRVGEFLGTLQLVHVEDGGVVEFLVVVRDENHGPDVLQQEAVDIRFADLRAEGDLHLEPSRGARSESTTAYETLSSSSTSWWWRTSSPDRPATPDVLQAKGEGSC